ncbi:hypothetical protein HU200_004221 [Digitaria exilis]|uniref:Uncharacterized protein n=1 Tax=Digitaria exilis TaxID=1010633 RepID=A0A835FSW8_9POAL|nr:hypothetical protein HU200_004221 [Digitaria exilis]
MGIAVGDEGGTAAASDNAPLLMMAARCGDSNELKRLIVQPLEDEIAVVVDHDDDGPPPAAALLLYATGGDSLLHVVAAASDGGEGRVGVASCSRATTMATRPCTAPPRLVIDCLLDLAGGDDHQRQAALVRVQNQCGETALHHANIFPIQKLLGANKSTAYQADEEGLYPIHVAAGAANLVAIDEMLLRRQKEACACSLPVDMRKLNVVKYVCRRTPKKMLMSWMLDAQDDPAAAAALV